MCFFRKFLQLSLKSFEILNRNVIGMAVAYRPDNKNLFEHIHRFVLRLLKNFGEAFAAFELVLRRFIEVGTELCKRRQFTELCKIDTQRSRDLLHRLDLCRPADAGDRVTHVDRGTHAGVEQVAFKKDLAVGDRDHVCRDVCRNIASLSFDDRQTRQTSAAFFVRHLCRTFEQA